MRFQIGNARFNVGKPRSRVRTDHALLVFIDLPLQTQQRHGALILVAQAEHLGDLCAVGNRLPLYHGKDDLFIPVCRNGGLVANDRSGHVNRARHIAVPRFGRAAAAGKKHNPKGHKTHHAK